MSITSGSCLHGNCQIPTIPNVHGTFSVLPTWTICPVLLSIWLPCGHITPTTPLWEAHSASISCTDYKMAVFISKVLLPEASKATVLRAPDPGWIPCWSPFWVGKRVSSLRAFHMWTWRSPPVLLSQRVVSQRLHFSLTHGSQSQMWTRPGLEVAGGGEVTFPPPHLWLFTGGNEGLVWPDLQICQKEPTLSSSMWNIYILQCWKII